MLSRKTRYLTTAVLLLVSLLYLRCDAWAQEPERPVRPAVRVSGEATLSVRPDQAQIEIGVVTQAQTAQAAATQNAQRLDTVLDELRRVLGTGADIKTSGYSLTPNYRYPREGGAPALTGYTARNTVQVKLNDLTQVGKVIDAATQAGANQIQRLQFTLKDETAARAQALREAATQARAKAEALAAALGLRLTRVLLVEEGVQRGFQPVVADLMARSEMANAPTPVEPGTIDVRATVTLTVEVAP